MLFLGGLMFGGVVNRMGSIHIDAAEGQKRNQNCCADNGRVADVEYREVRQLQEVDNMPPPQPPLPRRRTVIRMNRTTVDAMRVRNQVAPVPMEKAAPELRVRLSCSNFPTSSRGWPDSRFAEAHALVSWSALET